MPVCRREPGPPPFEADGVRTWCHLYRDAKPAPAAKVHAFAD
jgi:hypothetical protein